MAHEDKHHAHNGGPMMDNADVMHETSDANIRATLMFGVWLAVLTIVCAVSVWAMMIGFEKRASMMDPAPNPMRPLSDREMRPIQSAATFPTPRLQQDTASDIFRFRDWEQEQLDTYQVLDAAQGTTRIPIERAKELALERNMFPARGAAASAAAPAKAVNAAKAAAANAKRP